MIKAWGLDKETFWFNDRINLKPSLNTWGGGGGGGGVPDLLFNELKFAVLFSKLYRARK